MDAYYIAPTTDFPGEGVVGQPGRGTSWHATEEDTDGGYSVRMTVG
jgi:hypothetical protein